MGSQQPAAQQYSAEGTQQYGRGLTNRIFTESNFLAILQEVESKSVD